MKLMKTAELSACFSVLVATGCGGEKKTETGTREPAASRASAPAVPPVADADLLQGVALGAVLTNKELAAAEKAWTDLLVAMRPPPTPAEWLTNPPTQAEHLAFRKKVGESAAKTANLAREFYTKYSDHERADEAKEREQYLLSAAIQLGYTNAQSRLDELEEVRLKDSKLPEEERLQLRVRQVQRTAYKLGDADSKTVLEELEKGARAVQKEFPKRPEVAGLLLGVAEAWVERDGIEKARPLINELTNSPDADLQGAAEALGRKVNRVGKPVDIQFTAIDGRKVDLQSMRGKVILVDFWATWCQPCLQEIPKIKAAYDRLHEKGFEVVGISLDMQKDALQAFVEKEGLKWPQFFDESGEGNKFADQFEITGIPVMWMIDKKGNLRHLGARDDAEGKAEKLLAE
jgi:peroxiredoxin